ncbi:hypothetical protein HPB52_010075 [Rhipicephalus sanguineus]|uniref:Uncharacterized protein n=1 Tax=Rhipicephalus sanguineus TaxID=34632 RepID=A0A9D4T998_RHISA|nr:hypothetical protein HPB52_010075 [Rhipicephalus sanguineus]
MNVIHSGYGPSTEDKESRALVYEGEEEDDSAVCSLFFLQGGFLAQTGLCSYASGKTAATGSSGAEYYQHAPDKYPACPITSRSDVHAGFDPDVAGPSLRSEMQRSHQLRSRFPRPREAFMLFVQEKRRSVAGENLDGNDQGVSRTSGQAVSFLQSHHGGTSKAGEAATANGGKYPGRDNAWVSPVELAEAQSRAIPRKLNNDASGVREKQQKALFTATHGRGISEFQQQRPPAASPPPKKNQPCATSATRVDNVYIMMLEGKRLSSPALVLAVFFSALNPSAPRGTN